MNIKKIALLALVLSLGFSKMNAQESSGIENAIKLNPLAFLGGTDLLSYERALGDQTSILVSGALGNFTLGDFKYTFAGAGLQYRFYFTEALRGFYGGAIADILFGNTERKDFLTTDTIVETKFTAIGGGVKLGHQWVWDNGFCLDLNLGLSYRSFSYEDGAEEAFGEGSLRASGTRPTFGFGLGYAF